MNMDNKEKRRLIDRIWNPTEEDYVYLKVFVYTSIPLMILVNVFSQLIFQSMVVPNLILLFIFIIFILSLTSISRKTFIEIKKQKAEKAAQPENQADG
jgi:hypothetical protein